VHSLFWTLTVYSGRLRLLQDSGNCPVTGQPLTPEDLVTLQTNAGVKTRNTKTASLPGLLSAFQVSIQLATSFVCANLTVWGS
jgi:hypothetical protein